MTKRDYINSIIKALKPLYSDRESESIAWLTAETVCAINRMDVAMDPYAHADRQIPQQYMNRLLDGEPVQYVLGEAWFCGNRFKVAPGVLIPRGETEELVRWITSSHAGNVNILDIGTGSGAIAVSLALMMRNVHVQALDISEKAIDIALENMAIHGVDIDFKYLDILTQRPEGEFDIIVSNPPYIPFSQGSAMADNVVKHEPHEALFVPDADPLLFYRTIASHACQGLLASGGWLYFEIHESFAHDIHAMLRHKGFSDVEIKMDINDKPRMARCKKA